MAETSIEPENDKRLTLQVAPAQGQAFFCRRVEIPADVGDDEREGFLQLQLEGMSPFPLEHLQFGFVVDSAKRYAFLYAGYRRTFENGTVSQWEKKEAVIPEFSIGVLAGRSDSASPLLLLTETSITYFEFDELSELPCYFEAFPRSADESGEFASPSDDIESAKASLAERGRDGNARIWTATTAISIEQKRFALRASEAGRPIVVEVDRDALWMMDLREPEHIEVAKQEEQRNNLVWRVALGMVAAFVLLILGELVWFGELTYLKLRNDWNADNAPAVEQVISQQTTINELLSFQDSDLVPFDMLVAIQPFLTDSVWFTKVETNGPNSLKVFANATNNGQANQFKARLDRFPKIESVELNDIKGSASGTTFIAFLNFKIGAFASAGGAIDE